MPCIMSRLHFMFITLILFFVVYLRFSSSAYFPFWNSFVGAPLRAWENLLCRVCAFEFSEIQNDKPHKESCAHKRPQVEL